MPKDPDELLDAEEVAAVTGLTVETVYTYNSRGILRADVRKGAAPLWKRSTAERYVRERRPAHRPRRSVEDDTSS